MTAVDDRIRQTMDALRQNRMAAYYVDTRAEVVPLVQSLLRKGESVAVGGSQTLAQTGVLDLLRSGDYRFFDRYAPGLSQEQIFEVFRQSFTADTYLCSANAITLQGELYNVDGNSNRIAAICFGPRSVIIVAGKNKLVDDLDAAIRRVKTCAAPPNARRQNKQTACAAAGCCRCPDGGMTDGCRSEDRMCCNYLISARQRFPDRIKVILVGEDLGY